MTFITWPVRRIFWQNVVVVFHAQNGGEFDRPHRTFHSPHLPSQISLKSLIFFRLGLTWDRTMCRSVNLTHFTTNTKSGLGSLFYTSQNYTFQPKSCYITKFSYAKGGSQCHNRERWVACSGSVQRYVRSKSPFLGRNLILTFNILSPGLSMCSKETSDWGNRLGLCLTIMG